jgi:hypothetical protein
MNQKVYAVIAGADYEGEDFSTLRLFDCKSTAQEYAEHLEQEMAVDYVLMETRTVCMESALVA